MTSLLSEFHHQFCLLFNATILFSHLTASVDHVTKLKYERKKDYFRRQRLDYTSTLVVSAKCDMISGKPSND